MIHSEVYKTLDEEEMSLLCAVTEHVFNQMGLRGNPKWMGMFRVDVLKHLLNNINNLSEDGVRVRASLLVKIGETNKDWGF